nr:PREDICTED: basic salivary proline-rich protein 4-like isoform X2 [Anolis carolinensis]|eukprot:XP_016854553.1 PREDICTED: basic salivary proline-rich protein 4-like isoform X2 [Anolis carolinensis]
MARPLPQLPPPSEPSKWRQPGEGGSTTWPDLTANFSPGSRSPPSPASSESWLREAAPRGPPYGKPLAQLPPLSEPGKKQRPGEEGSTAWPGLSRSSHRPPSPASGENRAREAVPRGLASRPAPTALQAQQVAKTGRGRQYRVAWPLAELPPLSEPSKKQRPGEEGSTAWPGLSPSSHHSLSPVRNKGRVRKAVPRGPVSRPAPTALQAQQVAKTRRGRQYHVVRLMASLSPSSHCPPSPVSGKSQAREAVPRGPDSHPAPTALRAWRAAKARRERQHHVARTLTRLPPPSEPTKQRQPGEGGSTTWPDLTANLSPSSRCPPSLASGENRAREAALLILALWQASLLAPAA